ncbi:filamentous hemagglutinin family outer membrane protein [Leptolyngbya sp. Heron Island J]|uniref:two-partner secretion domain-containing protein n=1 Tax=Leptolyngbya sp. Heron Island J TaxID=1385935 RepID=UPI0003B99798|nr:filamentous hemagglutinin N-terminal domain-containing protein [Leptolyngbya sp. Heron Island J]ESA34048.1 filamentous hemagglutinin family outer membrane protein [Leptolyngbya sp. Heron Island J]
MRRHKVCLAFAIALGSWLAAAQSVFGQPITAADDGTGTAVISNGNQFDITGGSLSGDGTNLFHSFTNFGLSAEQVANFMADPALYNILSRVVGGNASMIDGTVQVSGGNANLYLMNPAGIIFGETAQINVPADFVATTADSIGFGEELFTMVDNVSYVDLMGSPTSLNFDAATLGTVMNSGELAVEDGHTLTLAGDRIINLGTIEAPGGTVTLAAVPEQGQLRISQAGAVISLGVDAETWQSNSEIASFAPLLTGGELPLATQVNVNANGQITLAGAENPGTAVVSGTVSTAAADDVGGTVQIVGPQIALIDATVDASGHTGGGTVLVGGEYRGQGTLPTATNTLVDANSTISASAGNTGNGGEVIVWADDTTALAGEIDARGGIDKGDGGFVEVSGAEHLIYQGTVDTTATNGQMGTLLLDPTDVVITPGGTTVGFTGQLLAGDASPTTISQNQLQALPGNTNVIIQATNSITIEPLQPQGLPGLPASLDFQEGSGSISFEAGGPITMNPNDSIVTFGRDINITGSELTLGNIDASGAAIYSSRVFIRNGDGGNVNLTATTGNISAETVGSDGGLLTGGNAGDIIINTPGSFTTRGVSALAVGSSSAGDITINAGSVDIDFAEVLAGSFRISNGNDGTLTINGQPLAGTTFTNITGSGNNINFGLDGLGGTGPLGNFSNPISGETASNLTWMEGFVSAQEHWNNVMRDIRRWDAGRSYCITTDPECGLY